MTHLARILASAAAVVITGLLPPSTSIGAPPPVVPQAPLVFGGGEPVVPPQIERLSPTRVRLGEIEVNTAEKSFTVNGRVIKADPPLEYLAVKRGGYKSYESIFELDTTATAFNLACILIGLDSARAVLPTGHFDPKPVQGDPVELAIELPRGGEVDKINPADIFLIDGARPHNKDWVYTGSSLLPDGRYLAEDAGTIIGFVHDRDSIIEHRVGIGLGQFGKVEIDKALLPEVGASVRLVVRNPAAAR
jgi:hypothetical protein